MFLGGASKREKCMDEKRASKSICSSDPIRVRDTGHVNKRISFLQRFIFLSDSFTAALLFIYVILLYGNFSSSTLAFSGLYHSCFTVHICYFIVDAPNHFFLSDSCAWGMIRCAPVRKNRLILCLIAFVSCVHRRSLDCENFRTVQ